MKVLITGRNGQVSQALQKCLNPKHELVVLGRDSLDLSVAENIRTAISHVQPDLIINAAAYTAVDKAESDSDEAFKVNAMAPRVLAEEAATRDIPLIHYSTDYVFDGEKREPYVESDQTHPMSVYGHSKLQGEQGIQTVGHKYLILRTSWVYSQYGHNFLRTMHRLLQEKDELRVVADQLGIPTLADTIATTTDSLIDRIAAGQPGPWGIYHLTSTGKTTWFGFTEAIARELVQQGKLRAKLHPISTEDYPTPARRPLNSRLDCSAIQKDWGVVLPEWKSAFEQFWKEHYSL
ncbi:dTDP-4-dehydrorhamnose reductase [Pseudomonas duriflava]|uniref:dTDP-4-dehydrorhamnose reductase n=1 Tax=Pseudomonas duriflava TaxID=459528 RepID=A0A562QLR0_9PSED|nr:dTDP-4-dehydrorhamnose reductase [Pseudomonas duriflava]TWI57645.1 dTDP-4-dehydrorhamnose reductase [Pseudomonas duriflava]